MHEFLLVRQLIHRDQIASTPTWCYWCWLTSCRFGSCPGPTCCMYYCPTLGYGSVLSHALEVCRYSSEYRYVSRLAWLVVKIRQYCMALGTNIHYYRDDYLHYLRAHLLRFPFMVKSWWTNLASVFVSGIRVTPYLLVYSDSTKHEAGQIEEFSWIGLTIRKL